MADITLEQVEKLRARSGLSYEEARALLEQCGGSVLDALIELERQGKAQAPKAEEAPPQPGPGQSTKRPPSKVVVISGSAWENFWKDARDLLGHCWEILKHCNLYQLRISRQGTAVSVIPIWVTALLLLVAPYVCLPLLVVGLFLGLRYNVVKEE